MFYFSYKKYIHTYVHREREGGKNTKTVNILNVYQNILHNRFYNNLQVISLSQIHLTFQIYN